MSIHLAKWVIAVYQGDKAKSVKAHADAGIGYVFLNEDGSGQKYTVRVALRLPDGLPMPTNSRIATPQESAEYDKRQRRTQGLSRHDIKPRNDSKDTYTSPQIAILKA
jgi:hypothetical protein